MTGRLRRAVPAAALCVLLLSVAGAPAGAGHQPASPYFDLGALPAPNITGAQIFQNLQSFVNAYPYRVTGNPTEIAAGLHLRDEMKNLGYEAKTVSLVDGAMGTTQECADCPGVGIKAVVGIKKGTTRPDEWIMLVGHYDTLPSTIWGAYDNGAGTNFIRMMARELQDVKTNRSIVFTFFNGEEEGLVASARYARYLKEKGQKITAVLGFDMVGIAYPVAPAKTVAASCLCLFHGAADKAAFEPLMKYVNYDFLDFPGDEVNMRTARTVRLVGNNDRNSDERSFANQGYPTMRWAGMRRAADYPAYHLPDDTIEKIVEVSGGQSYYEQGVENTAKSVYYTTLALDNHLPVPSFNSSSNGLTVSFDASGSSDEDGALSEFTWDFGDGSTGTGAAPQHTYAAAGTYTVKLTVSDNLWSGVTRSLSLPVTVG
ncbi:MAG TPA: M28 family peptidase [Actinomycetota bacterium]|nr:M28 family peptidase [Actinomycetota bacterium]